ncbi:uncharacterized protein LAJ45_02966 [Morchella importuna]|uniref:uncharacterized protein n=1 Tax=Morchella importuna TaxID=1174673 RepID=UPI001E8E8EF7|nr:uncharacterized protein LAJ45_02966 [Morchella importuna]KAH8152742.1 hypothetical protein LAJ45_02966 [Morchella importuna]
MGQIDPNIKDNDPCTPIHWAVRCRSVASVYLLLQVGADALIPEINGYTALYLATRNKSVVILNLLHRHVVNLFWQYACVLNELLQDGVDADAQDERGHPPLLRAFSCGYDHISRLLNAAAKATNSQRRESGNTARQAFKWAPSYMGLPGLLMAWAGLGIG